MLNILTVVCLCKNVHCYYSYYCPLTATALAVAWLASDASSCRIYTSVVTKITRFFRSLPAVTSNYDSKSCKDCKKCWLNFRDEKTELRYTSFEIFVGRRSARSNTRMQDVSVAVASFIQHLINVAFSHNSIYQTKHKSIRLYTFDNCTVWGRQTKQTAIQCQISFFLILKSNIAISQFIVNKTECCFMKHGVEQYP